MSTKTVTMNGNSGPRSHRRRRSHDARSAAIIVGGTSQYQPAQRVWLNSNDKVQASSSRVVQQRRRSISRRSATGAVQNLVDVKRQFSSPSSRTGTHGRVPVIIPNTNRVWSAAPGHAREQHTGMGAVPGLDATRRMVAPSASAPAPSASYAARVAHTASSSSSVRPSVRNLPPTSPPPPATAIVGASQQLLPTLSSTYSTQARDNQRPSSTMPVMSYAAAVGGRRPPVSRSSSSSSAAPLAPLKENTTPTPEYIVDDTLPDLASIPGAPEVVTLTTPRAVGRARSNSFYGRAQHTVLCRRRSPPPPPPVSPQSPNSLSAHTLTERSGGLRACAVNLDLDMDLSTPFVRPRASSRAAAFEGLRPASTSASDSTTCFISYTTSSRSTSPLDTLRGMSVSPFTASRTRSPSPPPPRSTTPVSEPSERDARARLVAGMLLNRPKRSKGPTAAAGARARRRALWACVERGEGGVFAGSCLRKEVLVDDA